MKRVFSCVSVLIVLAIAVDAQLRLPRASQSASVSQTMGVTELTINYSRPAVNKRKIWGDWPTQVSGEGTLDDAYQRPNNAVIVPYGHLWRAGANEATQFITSTDVKINGQPLPAGKYSLHTIPGKTEWTIIFNSDAGQWGSFKYDAAKDVLRVTTKPVAVKDHQELLSFSFEDVNDRSARVNLRWEKLSVPFTVEADTVTIAMAKAQPVLAAAKPDDWRVRYLVGQYATDNGLRDEGMRLLNEALTLVDQAIAAKETFGVLAGRANILLQMGRLDEGFAAADKAIAFGKANKADTAFLEKRVADLKAARK